jgi:Carboxypeptidase regulatory-like domain
MLRLKQLVIMSLFLIVVTGPTWAQQLNTAGLYGRVRDPQGAVIPGTTVTLIQVKTGMTRSIVTDSLGRFEFPSIPVGEYNLICEKRGFRKLQQNGIVLQVNENREVDVSLAVGQVSTTVTVAATRASVDTSNATLSSVVDTERVNDLPLNGRDLEDLAFLAPGVQSASGPTGGSGDGAKAAISTRYFSVNGSRQNTMGYTLDGGDNEDTLQNLALPFPFPDAVQEFSVETSDESAVFGRSSGGVINIVTKSGTNQFHGDAFWFVRNTTFDADDFFSHSPDQLKRNQAGGTVGGPVIKNKLFFFGGYQQTWIRQQSGSGSALSVPEAFRSGDFSSLLAGPNPTVIINPVSGVPFPNNQIPSSLLSPAAQNLLKYAPVPGPNGLVYYSYPSLQNAYEWMGRADYQMSDKNSVFLRLYRNYDEIPAEMLTNNIFSSQEGITGLADNGTVSDAYIFSPALLVRTEFTANRYDGNRTDNFPGTIRTLGVNLNPSSNEISVAINGTSDISLSTNRPAVFARSDFQLTQSWEWIHGGHSLMWGGDIEDSRYNEYNTFLGSGSFQFNGRFSGFDQADFMLGDFSNFQQGNGEIEFKRFHYFGFFGGDTFRLTPRLTLTYGARYEPDFPMIDINNRITVFNRTWYNSGYSSQYYVNSPPGLLYPGDTSPTGSVIPKAGIGNQLGDVTPRAGLAWDVFGNGRTSLRAGYGIYYDAPMLYQYNNMNDQSPFSFTVNFLSGSFDNPYAGREQDNIFPYAGNFSRTSPFALPIAVAALQPEIPQAYTQNWNLTAEHQFGQDWVLGVSYVGTEGTHLWADYDYNAPIYDAAESLSANLLTIQQRRPLADYQELDLLFAGLNSSYNSLQVSLNRRFVHGLTNQLSYTWSKALDYVSTNAQLTSNTIWDPFNLLAFHGPSDYDRANRFVDSLVWNVPDAGRGLHSRFASAILRDWQTSAIVTLQSGSPFSIMSTDDPVASGGTTTATADVTGPVQLSSSRSRGAQIAEYFNVNSVTQAAPGTFGTLGRNSLVGPGYANTDLELSRSFPLAFLGEAGRLAFRAEFFNIFNRPNLANPQNDIGAADFGAITSTAGDPRILQFSVKVLF